MRKQKPKTRELQEADDLCKNGSRSKGLYEILTKQAEGYKEVVAAAGGDQKRSIIVNRKLPELVKTQVEAVKIKIDKITVWDSGNNGDNGAGSTANFVSE
jgi:flotillin